MTAEEQLLAIRDLLPEMIALQMKTLREDILPQLAREGIRVVPFAELRWGGARGADRLL